MSYQKHLWIKNEIIRAKQLNHIEEGIYNEEQRASNAEELLQQATESEVTRATLAESTLSNRVSQLEGDFSNFVQKTDYASTTNAGVVKVDGTSITVDENGVAHSSGGVVVDSEFSKTSTNPVQNSVITNFVGKKLNPLTLSVGETTLTFIDSDITTDSTVEEYYSIRGVAATDVTVTTGQVVMTFEPLETALSVYLIIK